MKRKHANIFAIVHLLFPNHGTTFVLELTLFLAFYGLSTMVFWQMMRKMNSWKILLQLNQKMWQEICLVITESLKCHTKVKISKKLHFLAWNHWKNLLTSKRGHSGGSNFSTEFDQIWLKTSGGSRELIFGPICKCHTILESSWQTDFRFLKLKDLGGH